MAKHKFELGDVIRGRVSDEAEYLVRRVLKDRYELLVIKGYFDGAVRKLMFSWENAFEKVLNVFEKR